jgi:multiple sugar transport system substrate-binding protein
VERALPKALDIGKVVRLRLCAVTCLLLAAPAIAVFLAAGCSPDHDDDNKIELDYWEKWTRFEGEAMRRVVEGFNEKPERAQDHIVVRQVTVSNIDRKGLVAIAGGNPPDILGLWSSNVAAFADQGALVPLDDYLKRDGLGPDHWIPVYWRMCQHRGHTWAVPTTPSVTALLWNKAMFRDAAVELRAAGLDPNRAPQTIEELGRYADVLTKRDAEGNLIQVGFLPQEPDWFVWAYGPYFGGRLFRDGRITANDPHNIEAMEWVRNFTRKYGLSAIERFSSGFGNFASAQNPFFCGRIAMEFQGVWMHNFITQYAPGMEWGAAPWPKTPHGPAGFACAETDVLVIPRGVPRVRAEAAWKFLRYVSSQEGMELLCLGHRKNSPLARVGPGFLENHPHPYIRLFDELARSPGAVARPSLGIWSQYDSELKGAFEQVRYLRASPKEAMDAVQARVARAYERQEAAVAAWAAAEREKKTAPLAE